MRLALVAVAVVAGCAAVPRRVQRDALSYAAEIQSALVRQESAAEVLFPLAAEARERGDVHACVRIVGPALEIHLFARLQATRALWLAGLPYPEGDPPALPPPGTEQGDPVDAWVPDVVFPMDWCGAGEDND
jgi:hypothetical protein